MSEEETAWRLWQLADLTTPWALRVATTLGVADAIAQGHHTCTEVAGATGANAGALSRLLRHLVARGVFAESRPDHFELTEAGACLRTGHPSRMAEWLDLDSAAGRMDRAYADLLQSVRLGEPAYARVHGRPFYDDLQANPEVQESFDRLMSADSSDYASMVESIDLPEGCHVVDVGGGQGELLTQLLLNRPGVRGTLFELAATAEHATARLSEHGLADRAQVEIGSFFDRVKPAGADCYLLVSVLHNWNDTDAVTILRRTAEAAGPGGRVVLIEGVIDEGADRCFATHLDLKMLVLLGGRERTVDEYAGLAAEAGLRLRSATPARRGPFALPYAVIDLVVV